jgi:hypothetical protein
VRAYRGALAVTAVAAVGALTIGNIVHTSGQATAAGYVEGDVIASDSFSRTETTGFGAAENGGEYASGSTKGLSVEDGVGTVDFGAGGTSRNAVLTSTSAADSQASVTVAVPELPASGGGVYFTLQARSDGSSFYGATLRITPDGDALLRIVRVDGSLAEKSVLAGSTHVASNLTAGSALRVDLQVTGSEKVSTRARAYTAGTAAPEWQRSATDSSDARIPSGGVGVWTYLSSGSEPVAISLDDLSAVELVKDTKPVPTPTPIPTTPTPAPTPTDAPSTPAPTPAPTTPAPSPTTPAPTPTPTPAPEQPSTSSTRGSAPVGSTSYSVPAGAVFVSASAANEGNGSKSSPFKTVARAIAAADSGDTLVLRGGTYHEYVEVKGGKRLTIQSYPGEAVWFDGSEKISSWKKTGDDWVVGGWNYDFDTSPTFIKGAPDNTHESTKFLDPAFPLAAHPDQVWVDGKALTEVGSRSAVKAGTFYVDRGSDQLFLGTDPSGRDVRASTLQLGIDVMSEGSVVRGIGVQRYATSVWQKAPLLAQASNVTIENVVTRDNAASGIAAARGTGITFRNVTLSGNGRSGGGATYTDRFTFEDSLVEDNNVQRFKGSPSSGGFKIGRSRDVTFTDNDFLANRTTGLWFDESVYDGTVTGNRISGNGSGLALELSQKIVVADNILDNNETYGLHIQNTGDVQVWNNTIVENDRGPVNIVQDERRQSNLKYQGHDPRQSLPDMTVPWLTKNITVANNVLGGSVESGMLHVLDQEKRLTAEDMRVTTNGNLYQNPTQGGYTVVRWADGAAGPSYYRSLDAFSAATGQEKRSEMLTSSTAVNGDFTLTREASGLARSISLPLPSSLSGLLAGLGLPALGASPTP